MALLLFEGSQRVAPIYHEVLPRSQWIALFHRAGSSHERNLVGTRVSFPKRLQRVAPIHHASKCQFSTLEKTKLGHHPIWVACWERAFNRLFIIIVRRGFLGRCPQRVATVDPLSLSFRTPGILIFIASLLRAFWSRGWYVRRHYCNIAHHWSRFRCDSFFSWILL